MSTVTLQVPDDLVEVSGRPAAEFSRGLLEAAVVKWHECGKLSQGRAAEILGISRSEFLDLLSRFKVSIWQYTPEEIQEELDRVHGVR